MAKKPLLKYTVATDKLVIELSLTEILAHVGVWNRFVNNGNRKDPTGQMELYRVTDGTAFMKYVAQQIMTDSNRDCMTLPEVFAITIEDSLHGAAKKGAGVVELPWNSKDADGLRPAKRR